MATRDAERRARKILRELGIPEATVSLGLARQHVQLLDMVDLAHATAGTDGRALGAIGTASKQAVAVLAQLERVGEGLRNRIPVAKKRATNGLPPAGNVPSSLRTTTSAKSVDEWGMEVPE